MSDSYIDATDGKRQRISTYNSRTVPDTLIPSQPLGGITHEHY
jgi:hypothetical protein